MAKNVRKVNVRDDSACGFCFGEGRYERMWLDHEGEPRYYMQECLCEEREVYVIRIPSPLDVIRTQLEVIHKGMNT